MSIFQLLFPLIVMLGKSLAIGRYTPDCRLHARIMECDDLLPGHFTLDIHKVNSGLVEAGLF
jgi:hypothetical protein